MSDSDEKLYYAYEELETLRKDNEELKGAVANLAKVNDATTDTMDEYLEKNIELEKAIEEAREIIGRARNHSGVKEKVLWSSKADKWLEKYGVKGESEDE